jgi:hypothetical protein
MIFEKAKLKFLIFQIELKSALSQNLKKTAINSDLAKRLNIYFFEFGICSKYTKSLDPTLSLIFSKN